MSTYLTLKQSVKKNGAGFIVLIDPDKKNDEKVIGLVENANLNGADAIFVGGSIMMDSFYNERVKKIKSISIDRNKITKENLDFYEKIKLSYQKSNRPIIIFPQATRVNPDDRSDFKKGASRIYKELKIKCQPVAINSGLVWPKNGPLKANKKLTVSILEPINPNLDEKNFLELVQKRIYEELDNLN